MLKVLKPVLGTHKALIKNIEKKGESESRYTVVLTLEILDLNNRELKDVIFYDESNSNRAAVLPAIYRTLANQTGIQDKDWITDCDGSYEMDEDKLYSLLLNKEIEFTRTAVASIRNSATYYNMSYKPVTEEAVEL